MEVDVQPDVLLSRSFTGQTYLIPGLDAAQRFDAIRDRADAARERGMQVVVVQGLGFVGAVMAAVIANSKDDRGNVRFFVIGVDQATPEAYWKVAMINEGRAPVVAEDPAVDSYVSHAVLETANLVASSDQRAYGLADVVVVDVNLDISGTADDDRTTPPGARIEPFRAAIREVGHHMRADCLLLIETTVPPGTTERIVLPMLRLEFQRRGLTGDPLVAHSYERVMPGRHYVASIERFWRTYAADSDEAGRRAEAFLSTIICTTEFPLRRLGSTTSSELAKVLENSYRAANIALIHEWTRAAEDLGVNLFDVVDSIAVRKGTHDNIRKPGFGVGGYCLTKDSYLAQWGISELFESGVRLDLTLRAIDVNRTMPAHAFELLRTELGDLRGRTVFVAGVSYLNDVGDTRNSPTASFCDLIAAAGGHAIVHDPYVHHWAERPNIANVSLADGIGAADAIVLAVRHRLLLDLPASILTAGTATMVLDAQDIVSDEKAAALYAQGLQPIGVGKGHWRTRFPRRTA